MSKGHLSQLGDRPIVYFYLSSSSTKVPYISAGKNPATLYSRKN